MEATVVVSNYDGTYRPYQLEGNEAGVKAAEMPQSDGETYASEQCLAELILTSEETKTLYFALQAMQDQYNRSLSNTAPDDWEERMFLHEMLSRINKMLFDLELNHSVLGQRLMKAFINK